MKAASSTKLSIGAVVLSIVVPMANKLTDTGGKILEAKFVKAEAVAKDDSDFKDAVISDLIERVSELEKKHKESK